MTQVMKTFEDETGKKKYEKSISLAKYIYMKDGDDI